jgi:hypothetical protein
MTCPSAGIAQLAARFSTGFLRGCLILCVASVANAVTVLLVNAAASISVGSRPDRVLIYDSHAYVSNAGSDTVTIVNISWWNDLLGLVSPLPIPVGKQPGPMALSKDGKRLFVENCGGFDFHDGTPSHRRQRQHH